MDQRVTFQAETRTVDNMGGATEAWADVATNPTVWAHVRPARGAEELSAQRVDAAAMYVFMVRNRSDIVEGNRILWRGDYYNIRFIERRGERPLYLYIHAERGVGN